MSDHASGGDAGPSHRVVELGVAAVMAALGVVVIIGAMRAGIGWGAEGPKAGFLPFYFGLFILGASLINFIQAWFDPGRKLFADWSQLRQVMSVVIPTTVYVAIIPWLGIYVSSFLLIAVFMRWLGQYGWRMVALLSVAVPVLAFVVFERWFMVPLPKGFLEELLGY